MANRRTGPVVARTPKGPRRQSVWAGATGSLSLATSTKGLTTLMDVSTTPLLTDGTIVRIRGKITCRTVVSMGVSMQTVALGIMVVTDEAAAAGAASVPNPATDTVTSLGVSPTSV